MAETLLLLLLTAAGTIVGAAWRAEGLELGSLAAWFSGTASTVAVIVALRGHRKVDEQRALDRRERREAAAHQIFLKLFEIANLSHDTRRRLRLQTRIIELPDRGPGRAERALVSGANFSTVKEPPFTLSEAEAAVLALTGDYAAISAIKQAFWDRESTVNGFAQLNVSWERARAAHAAYNRLAAEVDGPDTRAALERYVEAAREHSVISAIILELADDGLRSSVAAVEASNAPLASLMHERPMSPLDLSAARREVEIALPGLDPPASPVTPETAGG